MDIILTAALLPAMILMLYVYHQDKVEKEPFGLLLALFGYGMLSCVPASILEDVFGALLDACEIQDAAAYNIIWHHCHCRRRLQVLLSETQNLEESGLQLHLRRHCVCCVHRTGICRFREHSLCYQLRFRRCNLQRSACHSGTLHLCDLHGPLLLPRKILRNQWIPR